MLRMDFPRRGGSQLLGKAVLVIKKMSFADSHFLTQYPWDANSTMTCPQATGNMITCSQQIQLNWSAHYAVHDDQSIIALEQFVRKLFELQKVWLNLSSSSFYSGCFPSRLLHVLWMELDQ